MPKITPPRGMRDFLPEEKKRRDKVLEVIRKSYISHGFHPIETPSMENIEHLICGVGQENEKLTYRVMRRGLFGPQCVQSPAELVDLGLRFDLTIPLIRFWSTNRGSLPQVFRALQMGPVWRAEKPQKGRHRQFVQCDIDIIGEDSILAEIELLTATISTLQALGITSPRLHINDRRILVDMLNSLGVPTGKHAEVSIVLDKLHKVGLGSVLQELAEFPALVDYLKARTHSEPCSPSEYGPVTTPSATDINQVRCAILSTLPSRREFDCEDLCKIILAVSHLTKVNIFFDPLLVRGMGYYTGPIFEIIGHGHSIAGGGRYDGLVERFGGPPTPACGFSIGFERILEMVDQTHAKDPKKLLLLHDSGTDPRMIVSVKLDLIAKGFAVYPEPTARNRHHQIERARNSGFGSFVYLDPSNPTPAVRTIT